MQSLGHSHIPRRRAGQLCQHLPGARVEPECQADEHGRCSLPSPAAHPPQGYPWRLRDPLAALHQTPDPDSVYREQGGPLIRRIPRRWPVWLGGFAGHKPGGFGETGQLSPCTSNAVGGAPRGVRSVAPRVSHVTGTRSVAVVCAARRGGRCIKR
jgi:hypothetical protein